MPEDPRNDPEFMAYWADYKAMKARTTDNPEKNSQIFTTVSMAVVSVLSFTFAFRDLSLIRNHQFPEIADVGMEGFVGIFMAFLAYLAYKKYQELSSADPLNLRNKK